MKVEGRRMTSSEMLSIISIVITSLVTIVGLRISYVQNKKNLEFELRKNQKSFMFDKTFDTLGDIMNLLFEKNKIDDMQNNNGDDIISKIILGVYKCGSRDAVKILAEWQQYNFTDEDTRKTISQYYPLGLYFVLITQLKYDVTGEIVNPLDCLKLKINDYQSNPEVKNGFVVQINKIIEDLHLNEDFKC
ncbi:hypothetical protein ACWG0P_14010 [Amedibacillus sp. YH-ame6]